jgi:hypothetical protein
LLYFATRIPDAKVSNFAATCRLCHLGSPVWLLDLSIRRGSDTLVNSVILDSQIRGANLAPAAQPF